MQLKLAWLSGLLFTANGVLMIIAPGT